MNSKSRRIFTPVITTKQTTTMKTTIKKIDKDIMIALHKAFADGHMTTDQFINAIKALTK